MGGGGGRGTLGAAAIQTPQIMLGIRDSVCSLGWRDLGGRTKTVPIPQATRAGQSFKRK